MLIFYTHGYNITYNAFSHRIWYYIREQKQFIYLTERHTWSQHILRYSQTNTAFHADNDDLFFMRDENKFVSALNCSSFWHSIIVKVLQQIFLLTTIEAQALVWETNRVVCTINELEKRPNASICLNWIKLKNNEEDYMSWKGKGRNNLTEMILINSVNA